jgi:RNA polymerase sigma-70 factor (sigma-E family)
MGVTETDSDGGALIVEGGSGDDGIDPSEAFDALVLRSYRSLARLAYLMSGDQATAEDIVSEAFARSWIPWLRGTVDELGPYVRRTVVNLCLQGQRRRYLERRALGRVRARPEIASSEPSDVVGRLVDLRRALQNLSIEHRAVIVLRFFADLSEEQTAELLKVPVGTVKSRTSRGLRMLRSVIGGEDND